MSTTPSSTGKKPMWMLTSGQKLKEKRFDLTFPKLDFQEKHVAPSPELKSNQQ
jgi:hypothetical protein